MLTTARTNEKMIFTINRYSYIELLNRYEISPKIIETQPEYEHSLTVTENLLSKRNERTEAETALFMLLVKLIRDYEEKTYFFQEWINTKPHKFSQHLMEAREIKQIELVEVTDLDKELVSAKLKPKNWENTLTFLLLLLSDASIASICC
jgi:HTH-type transcriptional regulator / antitoxin HigA